MDLLKYSIKLSLILFISSTLAQKKPIDHTIFDSWNQLESPKISNDGNWITYEINPQDGDGTLIVTNKENSFIKKIERGYKATFSPMTKFIVFNIKAQKDTIRKAKLAKKKKEELPKDSLGIFILNTKSLINIPNIKSYDVPERVSSWVVYLHEKEVNKNNNKETSDSTDKEMKASKFVILNPISLQRYEYTDVLEYNISKNGKLISFVSSTNDSIDHNKVFVFETTTQRLTQLFYKKGECKKIICNDNGNQLSFIHSSDTIKNKIYNLYYWSNKLPKPKLIAKKDSKGIPFGWCINENTNNRFSEDGSKLYFETAPIVEEESEDTLLNEEKVSVDIWNWNDELLQPNQKVQLNNEKKRTYKAVYHIKENKIIQLGSQSLEYIRLTQKGNNNLVLGSTSKSYLKLLSWDDEYYDYYLVNINNGNVTKIINKSKTRIYFSPKEDFVVYFNQKDSIWYSYSVNKKVNIPLTNNIHTNFYNELDDRPTNPYPYGFGGWLDDEKSILLYDRFDVWKVNLESKINPINLTNGFGRKTNTEYRYIKFDNEEEYISGDKNIIFSSFNEITKQDGYFAINISKPGNPNQLIYDHFSFSSLIKAKESDVLIWEKESFKEFGDLWVSDINFQAVKKVSNANPQQKDYIWGNVDIVEWSSFDRVDLQGLLYKPENLDLTKKYPMIVFFYERYSDRLHRYYAPAPSGNSLSITNYVSNGYIVFVPDIVYQTGYPGQSAYDAIVSGTIAMLNKNDFIDKNKLGLQGFSWGGYQTAYLITQTNLYSAAMAGAPVSNMTSAYGGIRWKTGMSRMFQYERTQSRIGNTLWKKPLHYIENSPLFYAPKVNTPILIMHNDADGAVPWYQGIEYFVALRRLNKPAWMLVYNDEGHSIKRRPNKKDFEIRMMQFFDHFLKGKPAPIWMKEGIPAIKKGKEFGYEIE